MDYNIHKICRVCLEEGALTSIYSTEFAMMPCNMMMMCAKIRVYKTDGLPAVICNNCIYRLGVAYHFKQECENSDIRLRQYLGLTNRGYGFCDAETNTEHIKINDKPLMRLEVHTKVDSSDDEDDIVPEQKTKRRSRYQRKPLEQHKKRGPKPLPKLPHSCYECNKTFKSSTQLRQHVYTHTGEKPFACNYCSRRFAQKYNLEIHKRTHTNEKPYQCEICSKQFSALGNFQAHQKIHTGVRDQMCPVCQKAFYTAGDLSKHMITHTGIKNHHCDICGKSFSRQRDMKAHKRKLHSIQDRSDDDDEIIDTDAVVVGGTATCGDQFKCPDCGKEFNSAGSLSVHFRTHTNSGLLTLPLTGQMPHPHVHPHHYHPPPPPPSHSSHPHDGLHAHAHHISLDPILQGNHGASMATMAHMLATPHPPSHAAHMPPTGSAVASAPGSQSSLTMIQRLPLY